MLGIERYDGAFGVRHVQSEWRIIPYEEYLKSGSASLQKRWCSQMLDVGAWTFGSITQ